MKKFTDLIFLCHLLSFYLLKIENNNFFTQILNNVRR